MGEVMDGFRKFILRGNVIDLAVGVVVGAAFNGVVNSLVANIISPLLAIGGGVPDLSRLSVTVLGARFGYGLFINSLISFFITAAVVYFFVVMPVNRLTGRLKPDKPARSMKPCPFCREPADAEAVRCPHCTARLPVVRRGHR